MIEEHITRALERSLEAPVRDAVSRLVDATASSTRPRRLSARVGVAGGLAVLLIAAGGGAAALATGVWHWDRAGAIDGGYRFADGTICTWQVEALGSDSIPTSADYAEGNAPRTTTPIPLDVDPDDLDLAPYVAAATREYDRYVAAGEDMSQEGDRRAGIDETALLQAINDYIATDELAAELGASGSISVTTHCR